jgi:hypothetical protein
VRGLALISIIVILVIRPFVVFAASQPPPTGYTSAQLMFDEIFPGTTITQSKWNPWMGTYNFGRWSSGGMGAPYSAVDTSGSAGTQIAYGNPYNAGYGTDNGAGIRMSVSGGVLGLSAVPNNAFVGSGGFTWAGATVSTYLKTRLPATGGYVQIHAQLGDIRYGGWPQFWMMPDDGNAGGAEFDILDGGINVTGNGNAAANTTLDAKWFGGATETYTHDTGIDLTAGYHTYGVEYNPGVNFKLYLDGTLMHTFTTSISTGVSYEIILDQSIASNNTSGYHTTTDGIHNGPFQTLIDNVQVYSLPNTVTVTYPFSSDSQGFVCTPATNVTCAWNAGVLRSSLSTKNAASRASRWDLATTWQALGVPVGARVNGVVGGSMQSQVTSYTLPGSQHQSGAVTVTDGATVATVSTARNFTAVDALPVTTFGTDLTGLSLPASDAVAIRINNTLSTANTTGAVVILNQDLLQFVVQYTPGAPSTGAPLFFPPR